MNLFLTRCQLPARSWLTAALSGLLLGAHAQPAVTGTSPARNANAAPRPSNVALTYSQPISAATASTVRVFSQQAGGRKALTSASASGPVVMVDPAQDFKPGETVFVTAPATVLSASGVAVQPYVYQFTAQAGVGPGTFGAGAGVPVSAPAWSVVAADLDGDGDLDLVTDSYNSSSSAGALSVRFNNGSGSFSGSTSVPTGNFPFHVAAADVDGDRDLDLLVVNYFDNTVSVRFNGGSGTFSGTTNVPVDASPTRVVAADVDGDGDLDMLVGTNSGAVSVRFNNGSGTFSGTTNLSVGSSSHSLTAADIDSDGDLDMLITNSSNSAIRVLFNNGSGTFSGITDVPVGTVPTEVITADVDGDGDLDMLAANQNSGTVSVRFNNGSGTFSGTTDVPVGIYPINVVTADVDGDGDLDFLTTNYSSSTVSVRLNNGAGAFSGITNLPVSSAPTYVAAVDLDGDSDLDFLVANQGSSVVDIRFNQLPVSAWTGALSTDWFTAGNWTNGVPTATLDAVISPSSFGRQPFISTGSAISKDLVLNAGTSLTMSGGTLDVRGDWANNGTFIATGGTVILGAVPVAALPGPTLSGSSGSRFWNLTVQANGLRLGTTAGAAVQRVLTLTGNLATLGNPLTLLSTLTGGDALVVNSGGVVTGTATVQRAIDPSLNVGLGYHHYSAPVSNSTVADLATTASGGSFAPIVNPAYNTSATPNTVAPFPNIFGYDQSRVTLSNNYGGFDRGYFSPDALTDPLHVGRGYAVSIGASELVDFQGTLNNGDMLLSLNRNNGAAEGGWHLLGNPYPAPLDYSLVAAADRPGLEDAIYIFSSTSPYGGQYRTYVNGLGANPVLPIGQGFFVRVAASQTSASLTFRNSQRLTVPTATTFQRSAPETRPLVRLTLGSVNGLLADEAYVYFQAGATAGLDAVYDGVKLPNPSGLNLTTIAQGNPLSINGLPLLNATPLTVPLTVAVPTPGPYTLYAAQLLNLPNTTVYLRDAQLGTLTDLHQQPTYSFLLSTASSAPRFELVFSPVPMLGTVTAQATQVLVYPNPAHEQATLELPVALARQGATLAIVDALGRTVRAQQLPNGLVTYPLPLAGLVSGVYLLRLQTEAGLVIKKLVIE